MITPCLETRELAVGYDGRSVVEKISIQALPGEVLSVVGPNGAGKTTLIRTLIRQLPPVGGTILLSGSPLRELSDLAVARSLAAVLTGKPDTELIRCEEVVALGRYPYTGRLGILSDEDRRKVAQAMELVGVSDLAGRDFERISDGQRQRVLLAR
ncbi:MAG: ABC transporter ATP-binding protein, partial [Oscillospiraceae bacterium]|nr:ABC transporter ATP-binding protein [Oscillospiraceae bacterium]